jgi:hypothetical protein
MTEKIKLVYTYTIALIVILGGLYIIFATRLDPPESDIQGLRLLLSGFVGVALSFVFNREAASGSAAQSERAYAAGLAAPTIPNVPTTTITTSEGPPATSTTMTVGASEPPEPDADA